VEDVLRNAHTELERRVEERTVELVEANEELKTEIEDRKRVELELREALSTISTAESGLIRMIVRKTAFN
jgi:C4-dicarboxylate-specific signal transduction histidine kinase